MSSSSPAKYRLVLDDFRNDLNGRTVPFSLSNNKEINFELFYQQNCNISTQEGTFTTIYLILESSNKEQVSIEYRFSIGRGKNIKTLEGLETFSIAKQMRKSALFSIKQDNLLDQKNGFTKLIYKDGKSVEQLEIFCEIMEIEIENNSNNSLQNDLFIENMKTLLESGKYSDAILFVSDKELRVHKNILAARSKVFSAMFEHDCEKKKQNRVEIIDIQLDVCEELLRYIYTEEINDESMSKFAVEFFVASDKYELEKLKNICEKYLIENLCIETVADILLLADLHQARQLKAKCIDFISENGDRVQNTSGWKTLTTKADLLAELFLELTVEDEQLKNPLKKVYPQVQSMTPFLTYLWKLEKDLGTLIENVKFSDAVFVLQDGEMKVHKNVLTVRSKVFANIFEQEQERVEMTDVSVEVCKQILRYIYTGSEYTFGEYPLDKKYANELLILSEKYELNGLKAKSELQLSKKLEIRSVSSTLLLADQQNALYLKEKCIEFITDNCRKVTQTEEWKIMAKTKPELGIELYEHIAAKQWN